MTRRGGLLLEALIALAVFVMAGLAILSVLRQGVADTRAARDRVRGYDIARSALAQIETGLATIESLDGSVPAWRPPSSSIAFEDAPPPESPWNVEITTEEAGVGGLSRVRVVVRNAAKPVADLTQFIQLVRSGTTAALP